MQTKKRVKVFWHPPAKRRRTVKALRPSVSFRDRSSRSKATAPTKPSEPASPQRDASSPPEPKQNDATVSVPSKVLKPTPSPSKVAKPSKASKPSNATKATKRSNPALSRFISRSQHIPTPSNPTRPAPTKPKHTSYTLKSLQTDATPSSQVVSSHQSQERIDDSLHYHSHLKPKIARNRKLSNSTGNPLNSLNSSNSSNSCNTSKNSENSGDDSKTPFYLFSSQTPHHTVSTPSYSKPIGSSHEWSDFSSLHPKLMSHLRSDGDMGHKHPTLIQHRALPLLLAPAASRKDVFMQSETGSGKTLAYLVPVVNDLLQERTRREDGTKCLILAPTRELTLQISSVLSELCRHLPFIVAGTLMGGEARKSEKQRLRKGVTIIIGTPGRILDHLENTQCWRFDLLKWFVLDECDRLLDLGFEKFIRAIVKILNDNKRIVGRRCNVLVSATIDEKVEGMIALSLKEPVRVNCVQMGKDANEKEKDAIEGKTQKNGGQAGKEEYVVPKSLKHGYIVVKRPFKGIALVALLRMLQRKQKKSIKCVIFMSTCAVVKYYYSLLSEVSLFDTKTDNSSQSPFMILDASLKTCSNNSSNDSNDSKNSKNSKNGKKVSSVNNRGQCHRRNDWFELRGDMTQQDRTQTYFDFCACESGILLCTDVAARGLDIPRIDYIIQYDCPSKIEDYIHRAGRTARMGNVGQSVMFLCRNSEAEYLNVLKRYNIEFDEKQFATVNQLWDALDYDLNKWKLLQKMDEKKDKKGVRVAAAAASEANKSNESKTEELEDFDVVPAAPREKEQAGEMDDVYKNILDDTMNMNSGRWAALHHLKQFVKANPELQNKGNSAVSSFIKAYTTYPRELKSIFYIKSLKFNECFESFFMDRDNKSNVLKRGAIKKEIKKFKSVDKGFTVKKKGKLIADSSSSSSRT